MDHRQYYNLESYLFDTVQPKFAKEGQLSVADFFCIVIWKANRAKSKIAKRLLQKYGNLETAVQSLTSGISAEETAKGRLRYLMEEGGFRLPMASAILSILYPNDFTIYDVRVCGILGEFYNLDNRVNFENLWHEYQAFKRAVEAAAPSKLNLRDKDRYLWGKSFYEQLMKDVKNEFPPRKQEKYHTPE